MSFEKTFLVSRSAKDAQVNPPPKVSEEKLAQLARDVADLPDDWDMIVEADVVRELLSSVRELGRRTESCAYYAEKRDEALRELSALREVVREAGPYLTHEGSCAIHELDDRKAVCDCGLEALRAKIKE